MKNKKQDREKGIMGRTGLIGGAPRGKAGVLNPETLLQSHWRPQGKPWKRERLYFRGDDYFRDLLKSVGRAKAAIEFETYIFEKGFLGDKVIGSFIRAARRGVRIRLLIDGVGSPDFASQYGPLLEREGIQYRVYRSWGVFFASVFHILRFHRLSEITQDIRSAWAWGKHRDHRKLLEVDEKEVWIGSFNVSDWHLEKVKGKKVWRDTGLVLRGVKSLVFKIAFHLAWEDQLRSRLRHVYRKLLIRWLSHDIFESPIQISATQSLRRWYRRELLWIFQSARKRIWITTPYFVPPYSLLKAIRNAGKKGCDVRILVPGESDVPMVRWASITFYPFLLKAGCRIFEFQKRVLHAKTFMVDEWVRVGSGNLDHRSLRKDLEVNVILKNSKSIQALEKQFNRDLKESREVTLAELVQHPLWVSFLSWFFFRFRFWF